MFMPLAPYIFYSSTFLGLTEAAGIAAEVEAWNGWQPAEAGRYKDDRLLESKEIKEIRNVLVNRNTLSTTNEKRLHIDEAVSHASRLIGIQDIVPSRYVVSKYTRGCHIKPHSDSDFFNTSRVFTGIFYINDEYKGGEIFFPKFGVTLKPQSGSLLLFLSEYLHGVRPILEGTRLSIVWFGLALSMLDGRTELQKE